MVSAHWIPQYCAVDSADDLHMNGSGHCDWAHLGMDQSGHQDSQTVHDSGLLRSKGLSVVWVYNL